MLATSATTAAGGSDVPAGATRLSLLFVSPVMPALTGNGLAMRAGAVLRALAAQYRVSLLVEPRYAGDEYLDEQLRGACERVAVVPPRSPIGPAGAAFADRRFDMVHVFRLAALPTASPYLEPAGRRHLDLDDLESETRRRLAELYRANGDATSADRELAEAEQSDRAEAEVVRDFDRVYVCSERDRARLAGRGPADVRVLPNTLPVRGPLPPSPREGPFTFLFLGTLGYYPNADGAWWWCAEVLPRLRSLASASFRLLIAGNGAEETVGRLGTLPEVDVVGRVADVAGLYERAHAVVVPLRAGGGTRIKVLEAFSFRRPVVSTPVGMEGIDACHGTELLAADTAAGFAEQCARLMDGPDLRIRLAEAAVALHVRAYVPAVLAEPLRPLSASTSTPASA